MHRESNQTQTSNEQAQNVQQQNNQDQNGQAGGEAGGDDQRERDDEQENHSSDETTAESEETTSSTDESVSFDDSEQFEGESEPSGEIIDLNAIEERHIRPIDPENALLENQTVRFPENNNENHQTIAVRQHVRNRTIHPWVHARMLEPLLQEQFGVIIPIFVLHGPLYQDCRGGQGSQYPGAHVNIFRVNPELREAHPELYWTLVDFMAQTENMPIELNHWRMIGGPIDELLRELIRDPNMGLQLFLRRMKGIFKRGANATRNPAIEQALELKHCCKSYLTKSRISLHDAFLANSINKFDIFQFSY